MKKIIVSIAILCAAATSANANTVILNGKAADSFIARHFPNASIPGPVAGAFTYINKSGRHARGHASCYVPAMGGRSDGEVSKCTVKY
jgi:hypothetical protein